jgi:hypothetical protein
MKNKKTIEQRILAHSVEEDFIRTGVDTPCWVSDYATSGSAGNNYPVMQIEYKQCKVHRIAFGLYVEDPEDKCICHRCDNRACWRPDHMFKGTHKENSEDMVKKGRQNSPTGDRHGTKTKPESVCRGEIKSKIMKKTAARGKDHGLTNLTEEHVQYIRGWALDGFSYHKIAKAFGISVTTVFNITKRKTWKHLPEFSIWQAQQCLT